MNSYDIDGVVYMGEGRKGLLPRSEDVIISGRSFEEYEATKEQFKKLGVPDSCPLILAPWKITHKTRRLSGLHKANALNSLIGMQGLDIQIHFEDDPVQADIIRQFVPGVEVVMVTHNLTEK